MPNTEVYQVTRRTNGDIKHIAVLPGVYNARSGVVLVNTALASKPLKYTTEHSAGRPTALPGHITPLKRSPGKPLSGTLHLGLPRVLQEYNRWATKQALKNQVVTSKITDSEWLAIYKIIKHHMV